MSHRSFDQLRRSSPVCHLSMSQCPAQTLHSPTKAQTPRHSQTSTYSHLLTNIGLITQFDHITPHVRVNSVFLNVLNHLLKRAFLHSDMAAHGPEVCLNYFLQLSVKNQKNTIVPGRAGVISRLPGFCKSPSKPPQRNEKLQCFACGSNFTQLPHFNAIFLNHNVKKFSRDGGTHSGFQDEFEPNNTRSRYRCP